MGAEHTVVSVWIHGPGNPNQMCEPNECVPQLTYGSMHGSMRGSTRYLRQSINTGHMSGLTNVVHHVIHPWIHVWIEALKTWPIQCPLIRPSMMDRADASDRHIRNSKTRALIVLA